MRDVWMTKIASTFGIAMALVTACDPGSVAPSDDDAVQGDDDTVTSGTGTIRVTYELLAVLAEGQTAEMEIVISLAPFSDYIEEVSIDGTTLPFLEAHDGFATGRSSPAEIVVTAGQRYVVTLRAAGFVAAPCAVTVERDGTVECMMSVGRDLTGMWELIEVVGGSPGEIVHATMFHAEQLESWLEPCPTRIWVEGINAPQCILAGYRLHTVQTDLNPPRIWEGAILDGGTRVEYTIEDGEGGWLFGPYRWERLPD